METLIVYASRHGSTEKCAYKLKEKIYNSYICNLNVDQKISLKNYDRIAVGSSINIGSLQKSVKKFFQKNEEELSGKKIYMFVTALDEDILDKIDDQIPENLKKSIVYKSNFGGKIVKSELKGIEKAGIEMMEKQLNRDFSNYNSISDEKIELFLEEITK